jgi:hypothetical protein
METTHYMRICDANETLADTMADAIEHDAALYIKNGVYLISSRLVFGARQVAPIFSPVKPLELRA